MKKETSRIAEKVRKERKASSIRRKCSLFINFLLMVVLLVTMFGIIRLSIEMKKNQMESRQEELDIVYGNNSIRRKMGNEEKRELQQLLREKQYTEVIPSTVYKEFNRFMCKLYTFESEKGTVEILINPNRKALILLCKDDDVRVIDIINNIDYKIGRSLPKSSIIFHNATWIADENGMSKWEFGKKIFTVEETFKKYENTTLSILNDRIIVSSGERLLEINEDTCTELLTDCKNGQYKFFSQSLFYINLNYDLVEKNLLTGEKITIDHQVYSISGELRLRYRVVDEPNYRFIPGYIDKEGNRRRFDDYEIDKNLVMAVN